MITAETALSAIPDGLRSPLLCEFKNIVNHFMEKRWGPAELSGGRFCEIVYTILQGHAKNNYASSPSKPSNFVDACRALEKNTGVPRSFQILIPRILSALYEIRNNRNVGHVGSDVNPDFMDSSAVLALASWVLAEMVRVFHNLSTEEAQKIVDNLAERRIPIVWKSGSIRRVLKANTQLKDQILLLASSVSGRTKVKDLLLWTNYDNRGYFNKLLSDLDKKRFILYYKDSQEIEILPPGSEYSSKLINK